MSFSTSVPQPTFSPGGFVAPAESAILEGVQADYAGAFGSNINPALITPQGQLVTSTTAIISDKDAQFLFLSSMMDPAYSQDRWQDAIARIYLLTRDPALPTALQIECGGVPNVVIPVGSAQVTDPAGNVYACTQAGTIAQAGTVVLGFANLVPGPVPVPASVAISQGTNNWSSAGVVSGSVGNAVESRAAFEARRQATVAANAQGIPSAVLGAVYEVAGVLSVYAIDNPAGTAEVAGGVTLNANSLFVSVYGGASLAVATAIWSKKNPGCNYTGNITVNVQDPNRAYGGAGPVYPVTFQTAPGVAVAFNATLKNSAGVPANAQALVAAAIQTAFTGQDGGTRAGIGSTIYASRYYAGVAALGPWVSIESIQVGTFASPAATFTGSISGTALTVSGVGGTIATGDFVYGMGVAPGTIITAGSGTSWTVAVSQTVASEGMAAVAATANLVTLTIAEMPTLQNADVNVILV